MRRIKSTLILVFLVSAFTGCSGDSTETIRASENLLKHSILKEIVDDDSLKTQVALDVLIEDKDVNKDKIKDLLSELYYETRNRTGFKYHNQPTAIYIYAFTSKDKAESGMGQWVGMISKNHVDSEPHIDISETQLQETSLMAENKFGLPEDKRQEIWKEIAAIELRAQKDADNTYPIDEPETTEEEMNKNVQLFEKLQAQYLRELATKYNITTENIDSISLEGFTRGWAFPKN